MIRIQNGILHTVECGSFETGYVDVENGKIVDVKSDFFNKIP